MRIPQESLLHQADLDETGNIYSSCKGPLTHKLPNSIYNTRTFKLWKISTNETSLVFTQTHNLLQITKSEHFEGSFLT